MVYVDLEQIPLVIIVLATASMKIQQHHKPQLQKQTLAYMNLILAWKIVETQVQYNISALVHKLDKREKDAFGKECIKKSW